MDLQTIGIYYISDIPQNIRTQQFQELLTKMDRRQRQSIDQNLRKNAETAGFSDIYTQDYSGYFTIKKLPLVKPLKILFTRNITHYYL